jgi:hypothetical protein
MALGFNQTPYGTSRIFFSDVIRWCFPIFMMSFKEGKEGLSMKKLNTNWKKAIISPVLYGDEPKW